MSLRRVLLVLAVVALAAGAFIYGRMRAAADARRAAEEAPPEHGFVLVCPSFGHGDMIPAEYTADGANASPPLAWDNVPDGTQTFALIVEDPDAPTHTFIHWMICEIPGTMRGLPAGLPNAEIVLGPDAGVQGNNDFPHLGYGGPNPPAGATHRYFFRLYALDTALDMPPAFTKNQLAAAMAGHVLGETALMGRYHHPAK